MKKSFRPYALALSVVVAGATLAAAQATPRVPSGATDRALFDDRVLHRLDLQISERDWETLRANYTANTYYPATLVWRGETARNVGIRSRGSGTRSGTKPGILVDFDRYVSDQRFLGLETLVLDNHLQDPSAMREALTMVIHEAIGVPAPREAPAALYINGSFFGVYTIVEDLDAVAMDRMFGPQQEPAQLPDLAARTAPGRVVVGSGRVPGILPPRQATRRQPVAVTPVEAPPTGYLFEYNWVDYFWGDYPGSNLDAYARLFDAETHDDESLEALYRPIEGMFREINKSADDQFVERVGVHLNLPLFVKLAAVQAYLANWDGLVGAFGFNNFYLYRPAAGEPHVIIPWDEDGTFSQVERPLDTDFEKHVLMRRAMAVPELRTLFIETIDAVAELSEAKGSDGTGGWLEREILRRRDLISRVMQADRVRPYTDGDFENAVSFNIDFARRRPAIARSLARELRSMGSARSPAETGVR